MRTETVVFDRAAPVVVHHFRTVFFRADAVHPVVFVGEAAARPAQHGKLYLSECVDDVCAEALCVGNVAVFADIYTVIYAAAEVLREISVYFRVDVGFLLKRVEGEAECVHMRYPFMIYLMI